MLVTSKICEFVNGNLRVSCSGCQSNKGKRNVVTLYVLGHWVLRLTKRWRQVSSFPGKLDCLCSKKNYYSLQNGSFYAFFRGWPMPRLPVLLLTISTPCLRQQNGLFLPDPTAPGSIPSVPKSLLKKDVVNATEVNQWRCSEESGQWLENVNRTYLVLASGKLVLPKNSPVTLNQQRCPH